MLNVNNSIKKPVLLSLLKAAGLFTHSEEEAGYIINPKFIQAGMAGELAVAAAGYSTRTVIFSVPFDHPPTVIPINRTYGMNSDKAVLSIQAISASQCTLLVRTIGDAFTTRLMWVAIDTQFVFK